MERMSGTVWCRKGNHPVRFGEETGVCVCGCVCTRSRTSTVRSKTEEASCVEMEERVPSGQLHTVLAWSAESDFQRDTVGALHHAPPNPLCY